MRRNSNVLFVKPTLEQLEDRVQPSFLLSGAIQQNLVPPLNAMVKDMGIYQDNLELQFYDAKTASDSASAEAHLVFAATSWQAMLSTRQSVQATAAADLGFINAVALAEFAGGDATDLILLRFGPLFGFNPTKAITDDVNQADALTNDSTVQSDIYTNLNSVNANVLIKDPIAILVSFPNFGSPP